MMQLNLAILKFEKSGS